MKLHPHISKDYVESRKSAAELVKYLNPTSEYAPGLEDTLILTMKGIAAGMQNRIKRFSFALFVFHLSI
ncbi:hypothetical protein RHMOL_Rhmol04G0043600 [Rhododendron molle]|uniref:Uncharacterized protein n=1 Tax=Rhododendron molle TaxID=49168 RepID=A0ACC0NXD3_RHOML|nr:hypothetical protein RHMOL_Rhmol04G0043600 [Rhododendron molle]